MWPLMYIGHFSKGQIHCVVGSAGKILIAVVLSVTWFITLRSPKCSNPLTSSTQVLPTRKHSAVLAVCKRKKKRKRKRDGSVQLFVSRHSSDEVFTPTSIRKRYEHTQKTGIRCRLLWAFIYIYIYISNAFLPLMIYQGEPVLMIMIALVN